MIEVVLDLVSSFIFLLVQLATVWMTSSFPNIPSLLVFYTEVLEMRVINSWLSIPLSRLTGKVSTALSTKILVTVLISSFTSSGRSYIYVLPSSGAILTSTCLLYPNTSPVAIALFQLNLADFLLEEPDMCFLTERERDVVIGR